MNLTFLLLPTTLLILACLQGKTLGYPIFSSELLNPQLLLLLQTPPLLQTLFFSNYYNYKYNNYPGQVPKERPVPGDNPLNVCDLDQHPRRLLEITTLSLSPNPPIKGHNLTITADTIIKKTIVKGAYVDVDVHYGYLRLLNQRFDLCEQIDEYGGGGDGDGDVKCPIEKGRLEVNKEVTIPPQFPAGKYTIVGRAYTVEGEFITCLSTTVEFLWVFLQYTL